MNSSETKRTPVRLTGLQVTDASVFEDFNARLEAFEETLAHVQGITDAEELAADVSAMKARLADISAGLGIMQETDALIAGSVVDVSSYAHGLVIPAVPTTLSSFTNDAGYLTEHQDISGLAARQEVEDVSAYAHGLEIPSVQGLATDASLRELAASIPENVQEYDDTSLVQAIEDVSSYARSIQVPVVPTTLSSFTNDAGYLTEHQSLDGLATDASLREVASSIPEAYDDSSLAQAIEDVSTYAHDLVTDASLQEVIVYSDAADASLAEYVDTEIGGSLDQVLTEELEDGFATKSWTERTVTGMIPSNVSDFDNDAGYLDASALVGLATDASLQEVAAGIPEAYDDTSLTQAVEGLASTVRGISVPVNVSDLNNDAGYLTQHQSLDGLATDASLQEVAGSIPSNVSDLNNDAGYLTQHQSLDGLATDASLQEVAASIPEAYDDTSLVNYIDNEIGDPLDDILDDSQLSGFATRSYVDAAVADISTGGMATDASLQATDASVLDHEGRIAGIEGIDFTQFASAEDIPVVPTAVSAFTNDAGYLDASTLDASFLDPVIEKFGDTDTVLDEILTGSVTQIDSSLLEILGQDVQ